MLIKSALLGEQASGSMGGLTAARNRFGQYFRARSNPVNPNTARQSTARSIFSALAAAWTQSLTQAQRDAWDLYGDEVTMYNKLGQAIYLTGFNHFIRSNSVRRHADRTDILDGPTDFTLAEQDSTADAAISDGSQQISTSFSEAMSWRSENSALMSVAMSMPAGAGKSFIGGPFRDCGTIYGSSASPVTSPQVQDVPWVVTEGQKVAVRYRIERADGRLSEFFRVQHSVVA